MINQDHERVDSTDFNGNSEGGSRVLEFVNLLEQTSSPTSPNKISFEELTKKLRIVISLGEQEQENLVFHEKMSAFITEFEDYCRFSNQYTSTQMDQLAAYFSVILVVLLDQRHLESTQLEEYIRIGTLTLDLVWSFENLFGHLNPYFEAPLTRIDPNLAHEIRAFSTHFNGTQNHQDIDCALELQIVKLVDFMLEMVVKKVYTDPTGIRNMVAIVGDVLKSMAGRISSIVMNSRCMNLDFTNQLANQTFQIITKIISTKALLDCYWALANEQDDEPLSLVSYTELFTWNCRVNFRNLAPQLCRVTSLRSLAKRKRTISLLVQSSLLEGNFWEVNLTPDLELARDDAFMQFMNQKITTINLFISVAATKQKDYVSDCAIRFLEEYTNFTLNSEAFKAVFAQSKKMELYTLTKNLLHIASNGQQYKQILRVAITNLSDRSLHTGEDEEELRNFYDPIEIIMQESIVILFHLTGAQLETIERIEESLSLDPSVRFYYSVDELFGKAIKMLERIQKDPNSRKMFREIKHGDGALETVWAFVSGCSISLLQKYRSKINLLVDKIFESPALLERLMFVEDLMLQFLQDCFIPEKKELVLHFFQCLYPKIRRDSDISLGIRNAFFNTLKKYCECLPHLIDREDIDRTQFGIMTFSFVIRLYRSLLENRDIISFSEFLEEKSEIVGYEEAYFERKSDEYLIMIFDTRLYYESLITVLVDNPILHEECLARDMIRLTHSILLNEPNRMLTYFEWNFHTLLYRFLSQVHQKCRFEEREIEKIFLILLNLSTNGSFYSIVQRVVLPDLDLDLESRKTLLKDSEFLDLCRYATIISNFFIAMMLKLMFEWNVSSNLRYIYLFIFREMLKDTLSNAGICGKGELVELLLIYLKVERDSPNKQLLKEIIVQVMRVGINVAQVKAFMRVIRFAYAEQHESYFRTLVSEFAQKSFTDRMQEVPNYFETLGTALNILKNVITECEDNENFINFTGESSGIILSNLNQSFKNNVSFFITFRVENLISADKGELISNYHILKDKLSARGSLVDNEHTKSFIEAPKTGIAINADYFNCSIRKGPQQTLIGENHELYYPRIFSISAPNTTLELYMDIYDRKRCLVLEGKTKKGVAYKEYFTFTPKENTWYTIILTYSSKNSFQLYLEPIKKNDDSASKKELCVPVKKIFGVSFQQVMENLDKVQDFSIGTSPPDHRSTKDNVFTVKNSFCGQVKKFFMIKKELSRIEIENILQTGRSNYHQPSTPRDTNSGWLKYLLISKSEPIMNYEQFQSQSLLNLNTFPDLNKISNDKDGQWTNVSSKNDKLTHNIINIQGETDKIRKSRPLDKSEQSYSVLARGVSYLEKSRFEDVFFSIGNVDILLYTIELLSTFEATESNEEMNNKRHDLLCEILSLVKYLCQSDNNKVVLIFLRNNGFNVIGKLLRDYASKFGVNEKVMKRLLSLIKSVKDPENRQTDAENRYKGFMAMVFRLDIWKDCGYDTQMMVYDIAEKKLIEDYGILKHFKRGLNFTYLLFYLQKLYNPTDFPETKGYGESSRKYSENRDFLIEDEDIKKLQEKIKSTVLNVLSNPLKIDINKEGNERNDSDEIIDKECEQLVRYLSSCDVGPFMLDFLEIIKEILYLDNSKYVDKLINCFNYYGLRDAILALIYNAPPKKHSGTRKGSMSNEYGGERDWMDAITGCCLDISKKIIFEPCRDKTNLKLSQDMKSNDTNMLIRYEEQSGDLFRITPSQLRNRKIDKEFYYSVYLKLFKYSLNNIGTNTFQGLMRLVTKEDDTKSGKRIRVFEDDLRMIGLILRKFTDRQITFPNKEKLLEELKELLIHSRNMKMFLLAPHALFFLSELINFDYSVLNKEDGYTPRSETNIKTLVPEILRNFIEYALYHEDHVFDLISVLEIKNYTFTSDGIQREPSSFASLGNNFSKMLKNIEYILKRMRERLSQKPKTIASIPELDETKRESRTNTVISKDNTKEELTKKLMITVPVLVYYYEYILSRVGKNFEQDEEKICEFTRQLFDFLHKVQFLHLDAPVIKPAPFELSASSFLKRFESNCHRNGGILLSVMTILSTVLRHCKIKNNKLSMLNCCWRILCIERPERRADSMLSAASPSQASSSESCSLDKTMKETNARYSAYNMKQILGVPMMEYPSYEKHDNLLMGRSNAMIYEFFFMQLFKQFGRESGPLRKRSQDILGSAPETPMFRPSSAESSPTGGEHELDFYKEVLSTNDISLELLRLLQEIIIRAGVSIRTTIQQNYPPEGVKAKSAFSLKKPPSQQKPTADQAAKYMQIEAAKSSPIKEIEQFCAEYNDSFKSFRGKENSSTVMSYSKPPSSLFFDRILAIYQDQERGESPTLKLKRTSSTKSSDSSFPLSQLCNCIMNNYQDLYYELTWSLNAFSLRHHKLIKRLNFLYFRFQIKRQITAIFQRKDEFTQEIDPLSIKRDIFERKAEEYEKMSKKHRITVKEWKKKVSYNTLKYVKIWKYLRQQLTEDRGVWQIEKVTSGIIRYKYDKTEDCNRRRMRMKIDYKASNKVYLTKEAFEEMRYRKAINVSASDTHTTPSLQLDIPTPKRNLLNQSIASEVSPSMRNGGLSAQFPTQKSFNFNSKDPILSLGLTKAQSSAVDEVYPTSNRKASLNFIPTEISEDDLKTVTREEALKGTIENEFLLIEERQQEKTKLTHKCERITIRGAIWGDIELTDAHLSFEPRKGSRPQLDEYQMGSMKENFIESLKKKQWQLSNIHKIYTRRYNYIYSAFEIITVDYKAYYFNLYDPKVLSEWLTTFKSLRKEIQIFNKDSINENDHQKRWVEGKLSNFDYLMYLNTLGGRSYNDITQYPVFPWIIADYTSEKLNINTQNPEEQAKVFRDLSVPMGAQLKDRHEELKERINAKEMRQRTGRIEPSDDCEFMYGSHYSTGGHIIDYLVRVEPFTSLQINLQSGRFDDANRIFASIPKAWSTYLSPRNTQNFKELVPEFFFCPSFLKNRNSLVFGKHIEEVTLPPWAKSPEEFIIKHREALECDYISRNLHKWIDLVFGYKQYGDDSYDSYNMFRGPTYEQWFRQQSKEYQILHLCEVMEFGQCPIQLLQHPHPARKSREQNHFVPRLLMADAISASTEAGQNLDQSIMKRSGVSARDKENKKGLLISHLHTFTDNPIVWLHKDKNSLKVIFRNRDYYDIPCEVTSGLLKMFNWAKLKERTGYINLGKIVFNEHNPSAQIATFGGKTHGSSYLVVGGYHDSSFKIISKNISNASSTQKIRHSVYFHKKLVTCIACCEIDKSVLIIVGSKDCRISIWKFDQKKQVLQSETKPKSIIYGHHSEMVCLAVEKTLNVIVSADMEGVVICHCLMTGKILQTLNPQLEAEETIRSLLIDDNGLIALITVSLKNRREHQNRVLVYTFIGDFICTHDIPPSHNICHASFLQNLKPLILLSTISGDLYTLNLLRKDSLRLLSIRRISYKDQSDEHDDTKRSSERAESRLKGSPINYFTLDPDSSYAICGYERGSLAIISTQYHENRLQALVSNLSDLGFLASHEGTGVL